MENGKCEVTVVDSVTGLGLAHVGMWLNPEDEMVKYVTDDFGKCVIDAEGGVVHDMVCRRADYMKVRVKVDIFPGHTSVMNIEMVAGEDEKKSGSAPGTFSEQCE